jgi:hypothetical protein
MPVQTLYPTDQNRILIVKTILQGGTQVSWVLPGGSGFQWSGSAIVLYGPDIAALATSGYLVLGNTGIAASQNILTSTQSGQLSDDLVTQQLLQAFHGTTTV